MLAARDGRLDWQNCLNRLIAKDASLNVQDKVRRGPRATCESWISAIYPSRPPTPTVSSPRVWAVAVAASRQDQRTAMHFAAFFGNTSCAESLLKAGADTGLKDLVNIAPTRGEYMTRESI